MKANNTAMEAEEVLHTGVRRLADNAEHMAEVANEKVKEYTGKAKDLLHDANNTSLADVEKKVGGYIRKSPGRCLLTAAAAGLVLGFFLARK